MTLDRRGYELEVDERFDGPELDDRLWLRHYLPHWSTRERVGHGAAYAGRMDDHLSTEQVGWILERSAGSVREMIQSGEIEAVRLPAGYRVPKAEVLRLARERIEGESDRKVSDRQLERLIDEVIKTNTARTQG